MKIADLSRPLQSLIHRSTKIMVDLTDEGYQMQEICVILYLAKTNAEGYQTQASIKNFDSLTDGASLDELKVIADKLAKDCGFKDFEDAYGGK